MRFLGIFDLRLRNLNFREILKVFWIPLNAKLSTNFQILINFSMNAASIFKCNFFQDFCYSTNFTHDSNNTQSSKIPINNPKLQKLNNLIRNQQLCAKCMTCRKSIDTYLFSFSISRCWRNLAEFPHSRREEEKNNLNEKEIERRKYKVVCAPQSLISPWNFNGYVIDIYAANLWFERQARAKPGRLHQHGTLRTWDGGGGEF